MWYLEKNKLISPIQNGFRKNRSTIDHLVHFESLLREASIKNLHTVAIFFDIEKAYDTTWKYGILQDLQDLHLQEYLPNFIKKNFNSLQILSSTVKSYVRWLWQRNWSPASYLQHTFMRPVTVFVRVVQPPTSSRGPEPVWATGRLTSLDHGCGTICQLRSVQQTALRSSENNWKRICLGIEAAVA